jgi:hypothetical protein
VALYFACKSNVGKRVNGQYVGEEVGEVIVFALGRDKIKYFDSDTASCIANLAKMSKADKDSIYHGVKDIVAFNAQPAIKRLIHFVREEKSFFEPRIQREHLRTIICVKGKRSNDRISSQSGAFLLFGLDAVLDEKGTPEIGVTRISISNKAAILERALEELQLRLKKEMEENHHLQAMFLSERSRQEALQRELVTLKAHFEKIKPVSVDTVKIKR